VLGPLGRRLAAGSVAVAFASIAVLTAVTLILFDLDIGNASAEPEDVYTSALAAGLRSAYQAADGWTNANVSAPVAIAQLEGFGILVKAGGTTVLSVPPSSSGGKPTVESLVVEDKVVGTLSITAPLSGLTPAEASLRQSLVNAVLIAVLIAAAIAVLVALIATRSLVAPIRRLTLAAARLGAGDRGSRVGELKAPGEIRQLASTFDDMAGDLEQADQLRRELVADVAHELRTPIAILRAELEAVSVGIEDLTPSLVGSLSEEVDRLGSLVEDLGILAEAEASGLSLERSPVDLAEVAVSAAERLAPRLSTEGVSLQHELSSTFVQGDRRRLEQVVVNLLSNAIKFSPAGGTVVVEVGISYGRAFLTVSDDGPGIPPAEQPRVFERFFRGSGAKKGSGSGIGLAVVAAIVAAHDGQVGLESQPGRGTSFRVELPLLG
jgi:two-component system sensor histidine kinase BaeS